MNEYYVYCDGVKIDTVEAKTEKSARKIVAKRYKNGDKLPMVISTSTMEQFVAAREASMNFGE